MLENRGCQMSKLIEEVSFVLPGLLIKHVKTTETATIMV